MSRVDEPVSESSLSNQSTKPLLLNKVSFTGAEFADSYYNSLVAPLLHERESNVIPLAQLNDELDKLHNTLSSTGLFKSISVELELAEDVLAPITKGQTKLNSTITPVNANIHLKQLPIFKFSSSTKTTDSNAGFGFRYLDPNLLKKACSLLVDINLNYDLIDNSISSKIWNLTLLKPLEKYPNTRAIFSPVISSVDAKSWANHEQYAAGALFGLQSFKAHESSCFGSATSLFTTDISFVNRQIRNVSNSASDSVRAGAGSDFKLGANFNYNFDSRKAISRFITDGILVDFTNELAGYNTADIFADKNNQTPLESFNKSILSFQGFKSAFNDAVTAEVDLEAGVIFQKSSDSIPLIDRFTLGGLNSLRGFQLNSIGAKDGSDFIGGTSSFRANLSLYAKLPNVKSANPLRLHTFINCGDVFDFKSLNDFQKYVTSDSIITSTPAATGVGLIYRGDNAVADLSYNVPLNFRSSDIAKPGFGFSVALKFA